MDEVDIIAAHINWSVLYLAKEAVRIGFRQPILEESFEEYEAAVIAFRRDHHGCRA